MHSSKHNINTGKLLREYLVKNRIVKAALAKEINRDSVAILRYTRNVSIQTGILIEICYALRHNFFKDIANQLPADFSFEKPNTDDLTVDKDQLISLLQEEIKILRNQNEVLLKLKG